MQLHLRAMQQKGNMLRLSDLSFETEAAARVLFPEGRGKNLQPIFRALYRTCIKAQNIDKSSGQLIDQGNNRLRICGSHDRLLD